MGIEESPNSLKFPPGFRFHPYDDELITHYLQNRVTSRPLPAPIMADIDLYKYDPWELPEKALFGEDEWYFFSPRERKYPNGARPNRAAGSGYWKATGTDRPILSGSKIVGVKKALVFYMGRPPQGIKTGWIMSEYRLLDTATKPSRLKGSMRLDDCVLCRVRQKGSMSRNFETQERPGKELEKCVPKLEEACPADARCHAEIIADFFKKDCRLLASLLAGQAPSMENVSCVSHNTGNNYSPVNEDGTHKANAEMVIPSFGGNNPLKRKASEEGMYDYLLPCNKKLNSISVLEDIPLSKTLPQINIYHNQSLAEGGFYDADSSDPIAGPLELNELSFDSECLQ